MFPLSEVASTQLRNCYETYKSKPTKLVKHLTQDLRLELFDEMGGNKKWVRKHPDLAREIFQSIELQTLKKSGKRTFRAYKMCSKIGFLREIDKENLFNLKINKTTVKLDVRVLVLASKYFFEMLENDHEILQKGKLHIKDKKYSDYTVHNVADYIQYRTNDFDLNEREIDEALSLCNFLGINFIIKKLEKFSMNKLTSEKVPNINELLKISKDWQLKKLNAACRNFLDENRVEYHIKSRKSLEKFDPKTTHLIVSGDFAKLEDKQGLFLQKAAYISETSKKILAKFKKLDTSRVLSLNIVNLKLLPGNCIAEKLETTENLKIFRASNCDMKFTADLLSILKTLRNHCSHLEVLDLSNLSKKTIKRSKKIFKEIEQMHSLMELNVGGLRFKNLNGFVGLKNLPNLKTLTLPKNDLNDNEIACIKESGIEILFRAKKKPLYRTLSEKRKSLRISSQPRRQTLDHREKSNIKELFNE